MFNFIFMCISGWKGMGIIPLHAMPMEVVTHVWMPVFSWRVNGWLDMPSFAIPSVQVLMSKNPSRLDDMLKDGMILLVRLSFITVKLWIIDAAKAFGVNCSLHEGTSLFSYVLSTTHSSYSSFSCRYDYFPFFLALFCYNFICPAPHLTVSFGSRVSMFIRTFPLKF